MENCVEKKESILDGKYSVCLGKEWPRNPVISGFPCLANLVAWLSNTHPCSLLQGHLACPGGMGVNVGNSEQEGENQELETEFWEERQNV